MQVHQGQMYGGRLHCVLHRGFPLGRGPVSQQKPKIGSCDKNLLPKDFDRLTPMSIFYFLVLQKDFAAVISFL